ncbi:MAG TPA: HEAT repeat domain-containing protein [Ktedonobacteraceae bacterium]|nr:HEAT repeat domain-containing protein [Ktedonobacteraceae bacterium]
MQSFSKQSPRGLENQAIECDSESTSVRAPTSAVNAIMGQLGLVRESSEIKGDPDELARGLADPSWTVRVEATQKLGKIGKQAPLGLLLVALSDQHSSVRAAAARALGRNQRQAAIPALVTALSDTEWVVRAEAALALGKMGELAPLEPLLAALQDRDASVRAAASRALGEIGDESALEPLTTALQDDEDWSVREAAALALGRLEGQTALRPLLNAHLDRDSFVRKAAEAGLHQIYPQGLSSPPRPSDSFEQWLQRLEAPQEDSPIQEEGQSYPASWTVSAGQVKTSGSRDTRRSRERNILTPSSMGARRITHIAEGALATFLIASLLIGWRIIDARPNPAPVQPVQQGSSNTPTFITYRGHYSSVEDVAWSPNGQVIASADTTGDVRIWQASTGNLLLQYIQQGEVLALTWTSTDIVLVAYAEPNRAIQVLELITGPNSRSQLLFQQTNLPGIPEVASWAPDQQTLAFDVGDGSIRIWNVILNLGIMTIHQKQTGYSKLAWSPDGNQLATISTNGLLQIWNVATGQQIISLANSQQVTTVTWVSSSQDSNSLFFVNTAGTIMNWWFDGSNQVISPFLTENDYNLTGSGQLTVGTMALSPDGDQLLLATSDGNVQARDAASGNLVFIYTGHDAQVNDIEWSPDGLHIATASMDTTVQIWQEP